MYRKQLFLVLALIPLILSGCDSKMLETVRKVTYPPDFNYISEDKLSGTMQQFAWYTGLLDNYLRDPTEISEDQRQSAIDILRKMETLSLELGSEDLSSTHDIVSFNIDRFRTSIVEARVGLQQDPPNYYLAGSVSAYCLNCHEISKN
ncbi:MAG: hypothetical protein QNJ69_05735 [Gammaproteobacteria bacterium]|nr:hypothetical protein [Gammaproteobacteria bacterium]